jgi:GNAT superfamily N-acetyltransferase
MDETLMRELESCEIEAWRDWYLAAARAGADSEGMDIREVAGGVAGRAPADVLALNRLVGFGHRKPATADAVDDIIDYYRESGARRFFVQVSPVARPRDAEALLEDRQFVHYNNWVKLYRDSSPPPPVQSSLAVRLIGQEDCRAFGSIAATCFGWPEPIAHRVADVVGRRGWRHYMAFDADVPVATGAFFLGEGTAWFDFAATLPSHRGLGAQSALLARRIRDAAEAGAQVLAVETAEQTSERTSPSWRNTLAFGFRQAYVRPNYALILADPSPAKTSEL